MRVLWAHVVVVLGLAAIAGGLYLVWLGLSLIFGRGPL